MMLASSVYAIFISALAVNAAQPKLHLDVSGVESTPGSDDLKVTATLTNKGAETVKLLNDPRGILSTAPTNAFKINGVNGTHPKFTGVRLKYSPKYIVQEGLEEFFTVLEPGKSVKVEHDLFTAYNFTKGGAGSYQVDAKNLFVYVDPETNTPKRVRAETGTAHKMKLSRKKLAANKRRAKKAPKKFVKRAGFRGCNDEQIEAIFKAAAATTTLAEESLNHLKSNEQATERYTTWWGELTEARRSKLIDHYTKLAKADFQGFNYDCSCKEEGVFAFVYPDEYGVVNLCPAFWSGQTTGTDSQAGTILHEASHFTAIAATEDHGYGQETCQQLAKESPDEAIQNADSHEYFSENNPQQEKNKSTSSATPAATPAATKQTRSPRRSRIQRRA